MLRRPYGYDIVAVGLVQALSQRSRQRASITWRYRNSAQVVASLSGDDKHPVTDSDAGQLSKKQQFLLALLARLFVLFRHVIPQRQCSPDGTAKSFPAQVEFDGARA